MRMWERSSNINRRASGASRAVIRYTAATLLVIVIVALNTWCLNRTMGQTTTRSSPEPFWKIAPLVPNIAEAAIALAAPKAQARNVAAGETVGRIVVPRMSLDSPIVEMANCQDDVNLNKGPGHINGTALPGAAGNCVIAGHRSTYTRPFALMGSLQDGDEIILVQPSGVRRAYKVRQIWVVNPNDVSVLDPTPEPSVTLITCHPVGSDASRLIIRAVLSS